ncbi:MAG: class I SAM-dependent methyltransferase [Verrucomicrobiota bacterium]
MIGSLHSGLVFPRRIRVLTESIAREVENAGSLLDVGCGDGSLAKNISEQYSDLMVKGVDVLPREETHIDVTFFDGKKIPFEDNSFDAIMCVDVLHHTDDPTVLLKEFQRVARDSVIIKDHFNNGPLSHQRLSFMDWVGNARYGVNLPYNYLNHDEWHRAWESSGLSIKSLKTELGLYPFPINLVFEYGLHFVVHLQPK